MTSMREQIVSAIVTCLTTPPAVITKPAGLGVHRYQLRPLEADELPAILVYWTSCEPVDKEFLAYPAQDRLVQKILNVRLEIRAIGDPVDQAVDAYVVYALSAIFYDPSLGGLALGSRQGTLHADGEDRRETYATATLDIDVAYLEEAYPYPGDTNFGTIHRLDFDQTIVTEPGLATLIVEDPTP